jgi:inosose dehydratase
LALGGCDPAEVIRTYHQRLIATHLKDVRSEVLDLARRDHDLVRSAKYCFCEIGQGGVNFQAIIAAFRDVQFQGWVICELDAYEPRTGGAATSAQMNRDAVRKLGFRI